MSSSRFEITDHAVQRYVERHVRGATYAQGLGDLERLLEEASPVKSKSINGQALWKTDQPPILFVVKPDGGKVVLVTVLPHSALEDESEEPANSDEVLAAYERIKPLLDRKVANKTEVEIFTKKAQATCDRLRNEVRKLAERREVIKQETNKLFASIEKATAGAIEVSGGIAVEINNLKRQVTAVAPVVVRPIAHDSSRMAALERKLAKQITHGNLMDKRGNEARKALRIALRFVQARAELVDSAEARVVFEQVGKIDDGFISDGFLNHKRDAK